MHRPSPLARVIGTIRCLPLPLLRVFLKRRVGRLVMERAGDLRLVILPEVFNPTIFRSSLWFAAIIRKFAQQGCASPTGEFGSPIMGAEGRVRSGLSVLDLGTGSGILALVGAQLGCRVVAVDINPAAVRCARINALMNNLHEAIDVRDGDLFVPVTGEQFDLVLFNPPFFRGSPKSQLDRAWRAHDVLERFASGLPDALAPHGSALIVFSANGDLDGLVRALLEAGLHVESIAERDWGNEVMVVLRATKEEL